MQFQLQKEEQDLEQKISDIAVVQLKKIKEKIVGFEEFELQMERKWQELEQRKNMLFEIYLSGVVDILSPGIGQASQKYLNFSFDPLGCISKGAALFEMS
ncbi:hypothetical protein LguiB_001689 [Lonicera macranthoides]